MSGTMNTSSQYPDYDEEGTIHPSTLGFRIACRVGAPWHRANFRGIELQPKIPTQDSHTETDQTAIDVYL